MRIAVGLRLGVPICCPHSCHALSCRKSEGRHQRHAALNDIIHRSAHVPSRLEPPGLNRVDGKRPNGVTTVPAWKCGKLLVWDATCPDTFAPSYVSQATTAAGEVATHAEERKCAKYSSLPVTHDFIPVAIETSGVMGPQSLHFLRELGRRVRRQTGDPLNASHLFQRLSTAIHAERKLRLHYGRS